ncbi:hypothetical protein DBR22_10890 [Arthrobacter sp. HMWF013]|nr:hypothetical protein DBR22_10890 [Arthrobacter sp. HMWF013]
METAQPEVQAAETAIVVRPGSTATAAPTASAEAGASGNPTPAAVGSEQVSSAEGTAAGFIAGSLGVLVIAAALLYWWKGRAHTLRR